MARVGSQNASSHNVTYTPPRLPAVLVDAHPLKPIVGVPADEEVKSIHAAIRAVNKILDVPALYDPDLPMQLAQHLFDVQMAVYRNAYSFGIFPGDVTYTPPSLPSHIPITLEPVVGAPSDEQLKLTQNAVRAMENLANTPSIFDPDLSMNLSQHLFNIQIARYIQLSTQGQFVSESKEIQMKSQDDHLTLGDTPQAALTANLQGDSQDGSEYVSSEAEATVTPPPEPLQPTDPANTPRETCHLLNEIGNALQNITQTLISTQHFLARSTISGDWNGLVDQKGDLPAKYGLPALRKYSKSVPSGTGTYSYAINHYTGTAISWRLSSNFTTLASI